MNPPPPVPSNITDGDHAYLEHQDGKWWLVVENQGGFDSTRTDLVALLAWATKDLDLLPPNPPKTCICPNAGPHNVLRLPHCPIHGAFG